MFIVSQISGDRMLRLVFEGRIGASSVTLIETSEHNILVDTSSIEVRDLIVERLNELGFDVRDIDVVINTHLHFGHSANNILFRNARIYASPNECIEKYRTCVLYSDRWTKFTFTPINEFQDDEITILNTPGHTWGSISVVYGDYIVAGDAVPMKVNLIEGIAPKCVDEKYAKSSLKRIRMLKKNVITGHDGVVYVDEYLR